MPRLALCDDSKEQRTVIGALLQEYIASHPELTVSVFSSGQQLLRSEGGADFDVYILDVVMPEMSGIELGACLRERNCQGSIIYLTISPEFAVDSYQVRAFHYLLKPVKPQQLFAVLGQALAEAERKKAACIMIKTKSGLQLVRMGEIVYAELMGHTARYHLSGGEAVDSVTLRRSFRGELEPLLQRPEFVPCGASFVANLRYVTRVEKRALYFQGGGQIPLPRGLSGQLQQQWSDYWLGGSERPV